MDPVILDELGPARAAQATQQPFGMRKRAESVSVFLQFPVFLPDHKFQNIVLIGLFSAGMLIAFASDS